MKIDHKKVEKLKSFNGVKLRGNETFDELLEIEKKNMLKGVTICKAKNCNASLYKKEYRRPIQVRQTKLPGT